MSRILDKAFTAMAVLSGLLLFFITFSISYSIFARFVGIRSPLWTVQFNEYALLWMTFLGTAWVLSRGKHVSVDLVTSRISSSASRALRMIHDFMGMGVCTVLLWYGSASVWTHFQRGVTDVQAVDMPKYLVLMVIPFGFLTLGIQFARDLFSVFRTKAIVPSAREETLQTSGSRIEERSI